jgi:hypothetical protein
VLTRGGCRVSPEIRDGAGIHAVRRNAGKRAAKGYRNLKTATSTCSHDLILYQAVQTEWYEAVAQMCEPLKIDLAKMHEEIGAGFMEACIAPAKG